MYGDKTRPYGRAWCFVERMSLDDRGTRSPGEELVLALFADRFGLLDHHRVRRVVGDFLGFHANPLKIAVATSANHCLYHEESSV